MPNHELRRKVKVSLTAHCVVTTALNSHIQHQYQLSRYIFSRIICKPSNSQTKRSSILLYPVALEQSSCSAQDTLVLIYHIFNVLLLYGVSSYLGSEDKQSLGFDPK